MIRKAVNRMKVLGGVIPDIPITVDASIPEDPTKTLRERLLKTEKAECWRCHKKMNPIGYAFEIYDDFGRYRIEESLGKGDTPSTKPIDAKSNLEGTGENKLDGDFKDALGTRISSLLSLRRYVRRRILIWPRLH
jgi:hypothetical protein